jgi:hypothetical protein
MGQILALSGLMITYQVVTGCFFQRIALLNPLNGEPIAGSERGYGFLSREQDFGIQPDYAQCVYYPDEEYADLFADGWMPMAKLFVMASGLLAVIGCLVLILACCLAFSSVMFERWLLWGYLLAACFMALSMLIFGSQFCADNQCKIGETGGYAISNFLFCCVMANTVKSMGEAMPDSRGGTDDKYDYDDDVNGEDPDDDDETGQDMYFETQAQMYPKRRKNPQQVPDDDDDSDSDDSDDDDDEESEDEDSKEQKVLPHDDDEENYDEFVGGSNGRAIT